MFLEPKSINREYYPKHLYKQEQDSMELLKNIKKNKKGKKKKDKDAKND
jgi:hypothetical protein